MESTEQILRKTMGEKKAQLAVKLCRKTDLDADVAKLENEIFKLEAHIKKVYPKSKVIEVQ